MLEKALEIAVNAHKGQKDKAGKSYIGHLIRVMQAGKTEDEMICGVLHDLVEDTNWTFEDLKDQGFKDYIIAALECLTKQKDENYEQFLDRILTNELAVNVKINDLSDNMDIKRLRSISEKDSERLNKYIQAYGRLINHLQDV